MLSARSQREKEQLTFDSVTPGASLLKAEREGVSRCTAFRDHDRSPLNETSLVRIAPLKIVPVEGRKVRSSPRSQQTEQGSPSAETRSLGVVMVQVNSGLLSR